MPPRKDDWDDEVDFEELDDESGEEDPEYYPTPEWLQDEVDSLQNEK